MLIAVAAGADLFIAEAYVWDENAPYHLRQLSHRERLTSTRTILTHMSADMLARTEEIAFDTAYDGLSLRV